MLIDARDDGALKLHRGGGRPLLLSATRNVPQAHDKRLRFHVEREVGHFDAAAVAELDRHASGCALDLADSGGLILEEVAELLGLTRERIRQIEGAALVSLRQLAVDRPDLAPAMRELAKGWRE